jgi:hypothetical protein
MMREVLLFVSLDFKTPVTCVVRSSSLYFMYRVEFWNCQTRRTSCKPLRPEESDQRVYIIPVGFESETVDR